MELVWPTSIAWRNLGALLLVLEPEICIYAEEADDKDDNPLHGDGSAEDIHDVFPLWPLGHRLVLAIFWILFFHI